MKQAVDFIKLCPKLNSCDSYVMQHLVMPNVVLNELWPKKISLFQQTRLWLKELLSPPIIPHGSVRQLHWHVRQMEFLFQISRWLNLMVHNWNKKQVAPVQSVWSWRRVQTLDSTIAVQTMDSPHQMMLLSPLYRYVSQILGFLLEIYDVPCNYPFYFQFLLKRIPWKALRDDHSH